MAQLREDYQAFVERGAEVVVVGPEGRDKFAEYWEEHNLPFVGLPDPTHEVASTYRQEVSLLKMGRMPALLVIDREGKVQYQHYGSSMSDIPPNEEILRLLEQLDG